MEPLLGHVAYDDRTDEEHVAVNLAEASIPTLAMAGPVPMLAKGESVRLFDFWSKPEVVADVGFGFTRIHQLTGSCVWAGGTNALFSSMAAQRLAADQPTKAFLPFTLHNYGASRRDLFRNTRKGEGSSGSTFAASLNRDGFTEWTNDGVNGIPRFTQPDGITVTAGVEMDWSSVGVAHFNDAMKASVGHTVGSAARLRDVGDIRTAIVNGYGISFACDRFIGHGAVRGEGKLACVVGRWDSNGGHQQSIHAYWEHPEFGPLYWAQNNWGGNQYPADPAGGPACGVWVAELDAQAALGYHAEVFAFSHLNWFPAQPRVLDWSQV